MYTNIHTHCQTYINFCQLTRIDHSSHNIFQYCHPHNDRGSMSNFQRFSSSKFVLKTVGTKKCFSAVSDKQEHYDDVDDDDAKLVDPLMIYPGRACSQMYVYAHTHIYIHAFACTCALI